jgi:uncharacterized protein (DUF488 family)
MTRSTIYTVGHSNTSAEVLLEKLASQEVDLLVDVRRYPSSQRHPHFKGPVLAAYLAGHGVRYLHEEPLGGHRKPAADSANAGLGTGGLRAYADHMATPAFREALERLIRIAAEETVAVMCAEADPERCHRRILSDALVGRGLEVIHILGPDETRVHQLHPRARVGTDGIPVYPGPGQAQLELFR